MKFDGIDFTSRYFNFEFDTQEERNEKIESIYSAFDPFKKVCNVYLDSQDWHTKVVFTRNSKLEDEFQDSFKNFNNEPVKVVDHVLYNEAQDLSELNKIQSQIDDIQSDIDDIKDSMPDYVKDNE